MGKYNAKLLAACAALLCFLTVSGGAFAQSQFFTPSQMRGESGLARMQSIQAQHDTRITDNTNQISITTVNIPTCAGDNKLLVNTAASPWTWTCVSETDPTVENFAKNGVVNASGTACSGTDILSYNGDRLECVSIASAGGLGSSDIHDWAETSTSSFPSGDCPAGQVASLRSGALVCVDAGTEALGGSFTYALDDLSDVTMAATANGQVLYFNSGAWGNTDLGTLVSSITSSNVEPWALDSTSTLSSNCSGSELLSYNGTTLECVSAAGRVAGNLSLGQLSDVTISSPASDSILMHDGTDWKNFDASVALAGKLNLADLGDVTLSAPAQHHVLIRGATDWNSLLIPSCGGGEMLSYNGTAFSCQTDSTGVSVPACGAGQVLKDDGSGGLTCVTDATVAVPTCGAGQVLTGNGTALSCVADDDTDDAVRAWGKQQITTNDTACGANKVLSYDGTRLHCVTDQGSSDDLVAAGNTTEIQFNNGGDLAGAASLTYTTDADGANLNLLQGDLNITQHTNAAGRAINITDATGTHTAQLHVDANGVIQSSSSITVAGTIQANYLRLTSDGTFKKDVTTLGDALDKIMSLRGVSYFWKQEEFPTRGFDDTKQVGLIAQEVKEVFPEAVGGEEGDMSVNYIALIAPLIEAVKEQQRHIEKLELELQSLKPQSAQE